MKSKQKLEADLTDMLAGLWSRMPAHVTHSLLPRHLADLETRLESLTSFLDRFESPEILGDIDPNACISGKIVYLGAGARIEAGAIVHSSCRAWIGAGAIIRSGAVLRDNVVIGDDCVVGIGSEIARSLLLPDAKAPHQNVVLDSILGRGANFAGGCITANKTINRRSIRLEILGGRTKQLLDTRSLQLGLLAGDHTSFGASIVACPGTIVMPDLSLPPFSVLLGTIDKARRDRLMNAFFESWGP